jgi:PAS domain S-box-containing protein
MLGYTEDELQGRTVLDITHEEDRSTTEARIAEALEGQRRVYRLDKRFLRKDGGIMWADISSVFVPASGNNSSFFSAVIVDRTEHQRTEEALQEAQAELAHITRVATMGELTASIAHEINQPLGAIANNAAACVRWLRSQNLEDARRSASLVVADAYRAGEIIGRIRSLAKKAPLQKDWLDVNEAIREVIAMAQGELKQNGVVLQTKLANDLPVILGDRIQLQQVLLNLLVNAVDAMSGMRPGQRRILVSSRKVTAAAGHPDESTIPHEILAEPEGNGVLVSLADSGPGVEPETVDQLFGAFYTTKPQGLGMGLAISRSILEAHGGRLWATANAPKGAVFNFILPIGDELLAKPKISYLV